jgi:hypothetical protein
MKKIEAGWYRGDGFEVYRREDRLYRNLFRKDGTSSPSYHTERSWTLKVGDRLAHGFATKASAINAYKED